VPLLFEAGLEKHFDVTMAVMATRSQQITRALRNRSISRLEVVHRIKAQLPLSVKKRMSDIVIDNRGSFSYTQRQVKDIWQKFTKMKSTLKKLK
jgi:dephospho-CoA kinase